MIRRQPRSTLIPHTTLFRSDRVSETALIGAQNVSQFDSVRQTDLNRSQVALTESSALKPADIQARDRKSTRLNSSHTCISYDVFYFEHDYETSLIGAQNDSH